MMRRLVFLLTGTRSMTRMEAGSVRHTLNSMSRMEHPWLPREPALLYQVTVPEDSTRRASSSSRRNSTIWIIQDSIMIFLRPIWQATGQDSLITGWCCETEVPIMKEPWSNGMWSAVLEKKPELSVPEQGRESCLSMANIMALSSCRRNTPSIMCLRLLVPGKMTL